MKSVRISPLSNNIHVLGECWNIFQLTTRLRVIESLSDKTWRGVNSHRSKYMTVTGSLQYKFTIEVQRSQSSFEPNCALWPRLLNTTQNIITTSAEANHTSGREWISGILLEHSRRTHISTTQKELGTLRLEQPASKWSGGFCLQMIRHGGRKEWNWEIVSGCNHQVVE